MNHVLSRKVLFAVVMTCAAGWIAGASSLSTGQDAKEKKVKGRLPAYYSDIVTGTQRQQIYDIQEKYAKQLSQLQEQINAIEKQRDGEIEAVLNADQKGKLKQAQEEGTAKKKKNAAEKKAAEEAKKATEKPS